MTAGLRLAEFVFLELPGDARHFGNHGADRVAVGGQREIEIAEDILEFQRVGVSKGALQNAPSPPGSR